MSKPKISVTLSKLGACPAALRWVRAQEKAEPKVTLRTLWQRCPNGLWLWWVAFDMTRDLPDDVYSRINGVLCVGDMKAAARGIRAAMEPGDWPRLRKAFLSLVKTGAAR